MTPDSELMEYTGHLLRRAQQLHTTVWLSDVSSTTTSPQWAALTLLAEKPGASQQELGNLLDVDRSTVADIVGRLVRRGLVRRTRSERDRRAYTLTLTPAGEREVIELRPRVQALEPTLTGGLTDAERLAFRRMLRTVLAHAGEPPAPAP